MEKRTKIIIGIVAGAVIIGGVGFYLYNRNKKQQMLKSGRSVQGEDDLDIDSIDIPDIPNSYPMGYLSINNDEFGHAVHLMNRPKEGTIVKGDKVTIAGTSFNGTYTVNKTWTDKNGNVGALYLNIPYTPTGKTDRSFEKKGQITKV